MTEIEMLQCLLPSNLALLSSVNSAMTLELFGQMQVQHISITFSTRFNVQCWEGNCDHDEDPPLRNLWSCGMTPSLFCPTIAQPTPGFY